jgi:hypothetical protein
MVSVFYAQDTDTGWRGLPRFTRQDAQDDIDFYCERDPETWHREDMEIIEQKRDCLRRQTIEVRGDVIGYQFNRNSLGTRRFVRDVHSICRHRDEIGMDVRGEVEILGRRCVVGHNFAERWNVLSVIGG